MVTVEHAHIDTTISDCMQLLAGPHRERLVGWLGFNGTFSTNRPYRAIPTERGCQRLCAEMRRTSHNQISNEFRFIRIDLIM